MPTLASVGNPNCTGSLSRTRESDGVKRIDPDLAELLLLLALAGWLRWASGLG